MLPPRDELYKKIHYLSLAVDYIYKVFSAEEQLENYFE